MLTAPGIWRPGGSRGWQGREGGWGGGGGAEGATKDWIFTGMSPMYHQVTSGSTSYCTSDELW